MDAGLRDVPIQKKLRVIFLIVSASALVGALAVFLVYQWASSRTARAVQLGIMAEIVAEQAAAAVEFDQKDQGRLILASLRAEPEIVGAALYDKAGRLFARTGEGVPEQAGVAGRTFEGGHFLVVQPVTSGGERVGTLALRSDLSGVLERLWTNVAVAALVLAGALAAVLFLAGRLGRLITGPVMQLAGVVQEVSQKRNYSARAQPHGADELGRLIDGFNDMISQIQARDEALARGREELEKRVEERTRELREKDVLLSEAQGIARLGAWEWTPATQKVTWSDELYRILARLPADFAGTFEAFVREIHPDDRSRFREKLEESLAKREPASLDVRVIRPDGEVRHLLVHGKATLDEGGKAVRVAGIMQDVTDRRRAEQAIHDLNQKLQAGMAELAAANKELEGFSYSVSHDLRAPLRTIDGYSRMLQEDCAAALDDTGKRYIDVIRAGTQKMGQLIDDLLDFSRLGRKVLQMARIDVEATVQSVWAEVEAANPGRSIEFRRGALPPCQGDLSMIRQVFFNLLANAAKYSRDRNPAVIEVTGRAEGAEAVYTVRDNGVGFDMRYANKLFGVFQRLHSAREFEGTGVGLALVQRIVQRHGGRVWGEGKVNEGATFHVALPTKEGRNAESERSGNPPGGGQPAGRGNGDAGVQGEARRQ